MKKELLMLIASFLVIAGGYGQHATSSFKDFGVYSPHNFLNGGVHAFNNLENTRGSRYFFDDWVKGTVINTGGKVIKEDSFAFNLDKVTSGLLVTIDKKNIIEVNPESIQSASLVYEAKIYSFERIESINSQKLVQVLAGKEGGYSLYKSINTHFVKANYSTNGITETGNNYDEYVDVPKYYIRLPDGKTIRECVLKPRSIKDALNQSSPRVKEWFSQHASDQMDEGFLQGLVGFLNT